MSDVHKIAQTLTEEGNAARVHFQIWWALRNQTNLEKFYYVMNNRDYAEFFAATPSAHFKSFLLALATIFNRDNRVAGLSEFRRALTAERRPDLANYIEKRLFDFGDRITTVLNMRSQSLVHSNRALSRDEVYKLNMIPYDDVREVIDVTCETINHVLIELGINVTIFDGDRGERATMRMLETLAGGNRLVNRFKNLLRFHHVH